MKQSASEIIALLTAIKDGAEWQYQTPPSQDWYEVIKSGLSDACYAVAMGRTIRLKPKPVMVPLGPEDFIGQMWWVRELGRIFDIEMLVVITASGGISTHLGFLSFDGMIRGWERSRDGKNWEPCEKLQA